MNFFMASLFLIAKTGDELIHINIKLSILLYLTVEKALRGKQRIFVFSSKLQLWILCKLIFILYVINLLFWSFAFELLWDFHSQFSFPPLLLPVLQSKQATVSFPLSQVRT